LVSTKTYNFADFFCQLEYSNVSIACIVYLLLITLKTKMATVNDNNSLQNEFVEDFGDDAIEFKDFREKWPNFEFKDDQFSDIDSITDMGRPRGMSKRVKALFIVLILLLLGAASAAAVFAIQSTNDSSGNVSSSVGNDENSGEVDVTVFGFSNPSPSPSEFPSGHPTPLPSMQPSNVYSSRPSLRPSNVHSNQPSYNPTNIPSLKPTVTPSLMPTGAPSFNPSSQSSLEPTTLPSDKPSLTITLIPTIDNTENPTDISSSSPSMYVERIWLEQMLSFLNDARSDEGASPLCFNQKLMNAAIYHVNDMYQNDFVSTTGSNNSTMVDR